ncbi:hypothetical protein K458DRAFT_438710 [Lentithecium fluviatile CBS 122367]|uniref:Rhodopsin domain-containing protein n=1 Tax=Lentithecium fluviatile CBS 122367 TaxID=1168545 RepID=A0A6G1JKA1_9PLEO|nr:hypothetical protein K458DRAFT_438710 [Lentithecium fluviatile CBS 122367]
MASWPAPNYVNPERRGAIVVGMAVPSLILVVVSGAPVTAFALASLNLGLGLHIWDLKPEWHTSYSKMGFSADLLFPCSVGLTKISLCLTYLRLFPSRSDKIFCYIMSGFVALYTVACIFLMLFQCSPIRGYWDTGVEFHCIDMRTTLISIAGLNSLSDFLVYLWPAKPLWSLQLPKKQRLGLICLFSVGCLVCIAGILRMYYLEVYFNGTDLLWNACPVYALMTLEMNLGIICGCLSGVKPVLVAVFPNLFGSSYKTPTHPTPFGYAAAHSHTKRTTGNQPFPFHPLSDVSNASKNRDQKSEHAPVSVVALNPEDHRNLAWASSSGMGEERDEIPHNTIQVQTTVMREEEEVSPTPKRLAKSDGSSEEWIMEDLPSPPERTKR